MEKSFLRTLRFLWAMVHHQKLVKPTLTRPCTIKSTKAWLDETHKSLLGHDEYHTRVQKDIGYPVGKESMEHVAVAIQGYTELLRKDIQLKAENKILKNKEK